MVLMAFKASPAAVGTQGSTGPSGQQAGVGVGDTTALTKWQLGYPGAT